MVDVTEQQPASETVKQDLKDLPEGVYRIDFRRLKVTNIDQQASGCVVFSVEKRTRKA